VTDEALALRVENGLRRKAGDEAYSEIWRAFLSQEPDRATAIYRFIRAAMKHGRAALGHVTHADVEPILKMNLNTGNEVQHLKGFLRFSLMENGVYFSRISPKNNCLPLLMPHFAERYSDQPFLIFDVAHRLAGVYDLKSWYLVEAEGIALPERAEEEDEWRRMWRRFYSAIAIKERTNRGLRRNLMPKRFWANMTEFTGPI
jgi:probable DNA metabolism protein